MTPLIDQLEAAGLVTRERGSADRRLVLVALTQAGTDLEHAAALAQEAVICRTGLTEEALAELREELNALVERVAASAAAVCREAV